MADEPRTWEQVKADAIAEIIVTAADVGCVVTDGMAEALAVAVLEVVNEEAVNRMAGHLADETRILSMDFRNGVAMDLQPSQALVAQWVAAAKTWLDHYGAENYTETADSLPPDDEPPGEVSQKVKLAGESTRYVFTLQRMGGKPGGGHYLTPHEARKQAEAERDQALAEAARLRELLSRGRTGTTRARGSTL